MAELIKAEFYKLHKLQFFYLFFVFAFVMGVLRGFSDYPGYQVYLFGMFPDMFDAVLISIFTASFLCMEFSNRTFGGAFLCGASRKNVFLAKLVVYFLGLLVLIIVPPAVSTSAATMRNGFGADWDTVALEVVSKLLFYVLDRFSMAGFTILAASIIQNSIGTLGIGVAGIYLVALSQNPVENPVTQNILIASVIRIVILLSVATFIFVKRDLK